MDILSRASTSVFTGYLYGCIKYLSDSYTDVDNNSRWLQYLQIINSSIHNTFLYGILGAIANNLIPEKFRFFIPLMFISGSLSMINMEILNTE